MVTRTKPTIAADVSPNLIPMIDIMFLLLLFFMFGADMGQRELEDVKLPTAEKATKEPKIQDAQTLARLTLNVYHRYASEVPCAAYAGHAVCRKPSHWLVGIRGTDYNSPARLGAHLKTEAAKLPDPVEKGLSMRRVMIRADAAAPYGLVQQAMAACVLAGIRRIECGAAMPPQARDPARRG
jgi:biopolymer transport protein ExbD